MSNLIELYLNEFMGKVFYFCLKKTGNESEAEDLTQDISLSVYTELNKGIIPMHFSAWVWQISKNRYSLWAEKKHKKSQLVSGSDIADYELADDMIIENELIRSEDLSLLRRELAFISSDYHNIIVAFYIDDIKAKDIAACLNLPESTIRSKLFRARNILKEGMSMAREFGILSYKPEDVGFIMNGKYGMYGEPWTFLNRILCKNILLAAYRKPSSADELAIELGVALPYMKDELEKMTAATLLRKNGNNYETNIYIVSSNVQERVYTNLSNITSELTNAMIALLDFEVKCNNEISPKWDEGYQPYEDSKWALLMMLVDRVNSGVLSSYKKQVKELPSIILGKWGHTSRPNGGEWDLLGLEEYHGNRPAFVGLHGCVDTPDYIEDKELVDFGQFKFKYKDISSKTPVHISYEEVKALVAAADSDTSSVPQKILDTLVDYGYLKKDVTKYLPTFLVIKKGNIKQRTSEQETEHQKLFDEAVKIGFSHYMFCRGLIHADIPDFFKDNRYQIDHACANIYEMRGAVLEEAIKIGYISYDENDERKMLGAYLLI